MTVSPHHDAHAPAAIRPAGPADVPVILGFIKALADYEKLAHTVAADEAMLARNLFGPRPYAECLLAHAGAVPAGFAVFFHNYSTFTGKPGLYLEDVFVAPEFRGRGIGLAFFRALAKIAVARDCGRFEWSVLDWNAPSIAFYRGLGAEPLDDWTIMRLTPEKFAALAEDKDTRP